MNFLDRESDAKLIVSRHDLNRYQLIDERLAALPGILEPLGFPEYEIKRLHDYVHRFDLRIPLPDDYLILEEQPALLKSLGLDYRHCPGHSQSDMVYLFGDYAVTGDVVLHQLFTTPLFDSDYAHPQQRFNSYAAYCRTIVKLAELEGRQLLTSHLQPLQRIDTALLYYVSKLLSRAKVVAQQLQGGKNIYETLVRMFGTQLEMQIVFFLKLSEVLFMADFLDNPELLATAMREIGLYDQLQEQFSKFL
jgi:2,4-dienoyl-CoA reductase (NADPH2)